MKTSFKLFSLLILIAVLTALMVVTTAIRRIGEAQTTARVTLARHTLEDDDILERLNRASRAVAASVQPSVVHIDVDLPGKFSLRRSTGSGSAWSRPLMSARALAARRSSRPARGEAPSSTRPSARVWRNSETM